MFCLQPIFYSSISDHWYVRRSVYFFSIIIYTAGSLGGCFAYDIYVLLGMRILQAVGISSAWAIGAGSVADVYDVEERGNALGIYFTGQFAGPLFGPIFGGFLVERWGWQSVFWLLFVIGCILLLLVVFVMEETYREEDKWGKNGMVEIDPDQKTEETAVESKMVNPLASLALLRHPFVFICATSTGLAFGGMFAIENMLPELYTHQYGFSSSLIGLSFISPGLGEVIGSLISGKLSDIFLGRAMAKRDGVAMPEDRLAPNVWPCAFLLNPLSFFLWGWPVQLGWNVWVSIIMFGVQCFAMVNVFNPVMSYLVDSVSGRGASVTAAANLVRMIWTFALSLIANPMTQAVGAGWVTFFFGMLNLVWAFFVLALKLKPQIRKYSGY
ncbi:major facilitator superfamily domain-containing protein [Zychaea mexicana]|uniref:major facilitator superfamily domain-containing protein n=1 Tax=Zychaea mexicana TaxID=64656 RepID=UPI0022FE96A2|nr:major facilitator superfamily domain-containing protein [Zychaea mexicana]KAI9484326.1 major facilitator superfamily domain-containing protein [Zychaea mexicana]